MFIDIHAHAYRYPLPFVVRFPNEEELLARYDECGIEKGFLLPVVNSEIYLPQANEDILEMAQRHPDRIIPFCNVDPRALSDSSHAPLDRVLAYYKDKGCRGVGEIMPNLRTDDERVQNLFRCAEKVGLPVTWDGSDRIGGDFGLYDEPGIPQYERTLNRFPNLTVFAHGPVFWTELWRLSAPALRKPVFNDDGDYVCRRGRGQCRILDEGVVPALFRTYPNLLGELSDASSMLRLDPKLGAAFLTEFQDRLFFGTDFCCLGMKFQTMELLLEWRGKYISEAVFEKIARGNAVRFFQLEKQ
ncbi:MAG: amidohydrolase family protein [Lentisphaeria bacterium]|nr:amidohydrolase family protein [Lentisphaeria bacterium]